MVVAIMAKPNPFGDFTSHAMFCNKNLTGMTGEIFAEMRFSSKNFITSIPRGEKTEYDLIVERYGGTGKLYKIQVKYATVTDTPEDVWKVRLYNKKGKYQNVDYIYIICDDGSDFLIDPKKVNQTQMIIRGPDAKEFSNQYKPYKYEDFDFENVVEELI